MSFLESWRTFCKQLNTQTSKPKQIYQTFPSYAAGTTTLVGTYGLAKYLFTHRTKIPQKQEITSTINTKTPKIKEKEGRQVGLLKEKLIIRTEICRSTECKRMVKWRRKIYIDMFYCCSYIIFLGWCCANLCYKFYIT